MRRLVLLTAALTLARPPHAEASDAPSEVSTSAAAVSTSAAVCDAAALKPLLDDQRLAAIAASRPGAALQTIDRDVYDEKERPGGGRRFVFGFALKSCATCEELADARIALDFDGDRHYLGPRLLTVSNPPLFVAEGEAVRGKDFEARIDAARVFRLKAFSEGWVIEVKDAKDNDYCSVVTPPYHGPNDLVIFGLHFRNSDKSGPQASEDSSLGARRVFRCVETAAEFGAANKALETVLHGEKAANWKESDDAFQLHGRLVSEAQRGRLTLSRLALGNLGAGRRPWIESMHFRFELRPSEANAP
jgi:hypothetical protein